MLWVIAMYNQEIKERYIEVCSTSKFAELMERLFEKSSTCEDLLSKDVAEMSLEEAKNLLNTLDFYELATLESFVSGLKAYRKWCENERCFDELGNGFLKVQAKDAELSKNFSRMIFRDEADLMRSIRKVKELDDGWPEPVVAALLWIGVEAKDIISLKDKDVDLENRIVYGSNGAVLAKGFSDEIHNVLNLFVKCNSGTRGTYTVIKDRSRDEFLKRFCAVNSPKMGKKLTYAQIAGAFDRMNTEYENKGYFPRFSVKNIFRSGALSRVFQLEQSGVDVFDKSNAELVEVAYGFSKYRAIIWQYRCYKSAFNL